MRPISLAVDVTNYVMLELGRPIHGYDGDKLAGPDRGTPGARGRAADHPRRRRPRAVDRGPRRHRRLRRRSASAASWAARPPRCPRRPRTVVVEAAHWDAVSMFRTGKRHKLTSEAGKRNERGVDPTICEAAADRVVELLVDATAAAPSSPGVTVVGTPPAPRADHDRRRPARPGHRHGDRRATRWSRTCEAVGCRGRRRRRRARRVTPPPWRPDLTDPYDLVEEVVRIVGYDQVPSVLPTAAGRSRADPRAAAAPPDRPHPGRRRAASRWSASRSSARPPSTRSGLPDDDRAARTPSGWPTRSRPRSRSYTTTLLPGRARGRRPQPRARCAGRRALRDRHGRLPASTAGRRRSTASTGGPREAELRQAARGAARRSRCTWPAVLGGEREPAGWWGAGPRRPTGPTRSSVVRRLGRRARRRGRASRPTARMPWHPGRCAGSSVGDDELGHAGELHPRVCAAFGAARAHGGRSRSTSTC